MNQNRVKIENNVRRKMKKTILTTCDQKLRYFCEIYQQLRFKIHFEFLKNRF